MSAIAVLPVIDPARGNACLDSMAPWFISQTLVVDNTAEGAHGNELRIFDPDRGMKPYAEFRLSSERDPRGGHNLGVAASWNRGVRLVLADHLDYLIIVSAGVTFGPPGGHDFLRVIREHQPEPGLWSHLGWHLCAISRQTLKTVGEFDEGFWPGYYEDTDYLYRMGLAGLPSPRENGRPLPQVEVDATVPTVAHSVPFAQPDFGELSQRYTAKWGGQQGFEQFTEPWDGAPP